MADMRTGFEVGANIAPFEQGMRRMVGISRDASQGVQGSFSTMTAPLASLQTAYAAIAGVVSGVLVGGFIKLSDEATMARARIQQLTGSMAETRAVQQDLFAMAQRLQAPYAEVQQAFTRMLPSVKELGGGVREATVLTNILLSTAKMAGASSAEAAASMTQFAQALGSGKLQGDELKSILENNQVLARELAGALGVTIGELRKMGEEGELTSDRVANALLSRAEEIEASVSNLPDTVGGAFEQISNSVGLMVDAFNTGGGVTEYLIEILKGLADVLDTVTSSINSTSGASSDLGANDGAASFGRRVSATFAELIDYGVSVYNTIMMVIRAANALQSMASLTMSGQFAAGQKAFDSEYAKAIEHGQKAISGAMNAGDAYRKRALDQATRKMLAPDLANPYAKLTTLKGKGGADDDKKKGGKKKGGAKKKGGGSGSPMSKWNEELQAQKTAYAEMQAAQGTYQEFSKASELAFWREKLQHVNANSKEGLQIRQKIAALELAVHKEKVKEAQRLGKAEIEEQRNAELHKLAMAETASDTALALGQVTNLQRLQQQQLFEDQRYQVEQKALQDRIELAKQDPNMSPEALAQIHEKLLELQRKYELKKAQIGGQVKVANKQENPGFMDLFQQGAGNSFDALGNAFGQMLDSVIARTATFRQAMGNMFRQIGQTFLQELVFKPLQGVIMSVIKQTALYKMLTGVQVAQQATASAAVVGAKSAETATVVGQNAAQGASGAAASQASIPYVGPALAVAAAAAMLAFITGFGKGSGNSTSTTVTRIPSAAGGWDIPAGLNPMTQLHEREMILPAEHADTIRGLSGAGQAPIVINTSGGDFIHKKDLARMLKTMKRDFRFA